jgi:hypothetical protein
VAIALPSALPKAVMLTKVGRWIHIEVQQAMGK